MSLKVNAASRELTQVKREPVFPFATGGEETNFTTMNTKRLIVESTHMVANLNYNFAVVIDNFEISLCQVPMSIMTGVLLWV